MKINSKDTYLKYNFYHVDDMLLEELKKVLNRCLSFWEIHVKVAGVEDMNYTYRIEDEITYDEIHFSPIIVVPDKIQIFPINKDIGTILFNLFSDQETLLNMMQKKSQSEVNKQLKYVFNISGSIETVINNELEKMRVNRDPRDIQLIKKFIFCSYIFIVLQNCNVFPKNKKYPETYDEIFTMFSEDKDKITTIKNMIYTTPINQSYYDFFVPAVSLQKALSPPASSVLSKPSSLLPSTPPPFSVSTDVARLKPPGGEAVINKRGGGSIKKKILKKPKKTIRNTK